MIAGNAKARKVTIRAKIIRADGRVEDLGVISRSDGSGNLQVPYSGPSAKGATVYVAVVQPDTTPEESMIWTDEVK